VLSRIASQKLAAFVVWVPQLAGTYDDARWASHIISDHRARQYWDPADVTGREFERVLLTPGPAWDVYLAYDAGVRWTTTLPPRPIYWMQQLGMPNVPRLDGATLAEHIRTLLAAQ
jgi:hypothetical protein